MSEVWYHCGHCGSLFESDFGYDRLRVCTLCKKKPDTGIRPLPEKIRAEVKTGMSGFQNKGQVLIDHPKKGGSGKRGASHIMWKVAVIWILLMLVAVWLRYHFTKVETEAGKKGAIPAKVEKGISSE